MTDTTFPIFESHSKTVECPGCGFQVTQKTNYLNDSSTLICTDCNEIMDNPEYHTVE